MELRRKTRNAKGTYARHLEKLHWNQRKCSCSSTICTRVLDSLTYVLQGEKHSNCTSEYVHRFEGIHSSITTTVCPRRHSYHCRAPLTISAQQAGGTHKWGDQWRARRDGVVESQNIPNKVSIDYIPRCSTPTDPPFYLGECQTK